MNTKLSTLIIGTALVVLTGCGDKGSDSKSAAIPGLPAGRIAVTTNGTADLYNYCDVAPDQKSMTCVTSIPSGTSVITCPALTISYVDQISMCNAMNTTLQQRLVNNGAMNGQCGANSGRLAMDNAFRTLCTNVANTNVNNNTPYIPPMVDGGTIPQNTSRAIGCEFRAVHKVGRYVQIIKPFSDVRMLTNSKRKASIDSGSRFGKADFSFDPASDKITISASGVNKDTDIVQVGSATQEVSLDVHNEDGSVNVKMFCKDVSGAAPIAKDVLSYSCKGKSRLTNTTEYIDTVVAVEDLNFDEVELAKNLTIRMNQGATGLNNALISLVAKGVSRADSSVISSSSIYSAAKILINDGASKVDVTCLPRAY